jgi:hypothetical protein
MVSTGEQRSAGGRADRRHREVSVADASCGQRIQIRRLDLRSVAADVGKSQVIGQHDHDIGPCRRQSRGLLEVRLRLADAALDLAAECGFGHGFRIGQLRLAAAGKTRKREGEEQEDQGCSNR